MEQFLERSGLHRKQLVSLAHWLVVAMAATLPWSTSALSILLCIWAVVVIATTDWETIRTELLTPLGGLPVLLFIVALAGTFWSSGSPAERWDGFRAFIRFLAIPLFLSQYRRSGDGRAVLVAFMLSCTVLLITSYVGFLRHWPAEVPGVPVKDYITQSLEFTICAALLLPYTTQWRQPKRALAAGILAAVFLANVAFVATGRTTLVVIAALILVFGFRAAGWKGILTAGLAGIIGLVLVWELSPFLRGRVLGVYNEVKLAQSSKELTSSGERVAFWRKSLHFIADAPLIGHGVGSIPSLYRKAAVDQSGVDGVISTNPHNQTFTVGIQLGIVGMVLLWLIWLTQLLFFRHPGAIMWAGTVLVTQNVIGSLFNSFIFDFTAGWLYIIGVGVAAGVALRGLPQHESLRGESSTSASITG